MDTIELLTLEKVNEILNSEDKSKRKAKGFCNKYGVTVFSLGNDKTKYVLKIEFYKAFYKSLKSRKGINLTDYTQSYIKVFSQHYAEREQMKFNSNYKPVGEYEKKFANQLREIIKQQ